MDFPSYIIQKGALRELKNQLRIGQNLAFISPHKTGKKSMVKMVMKEFANYDKHYFLEFNLLRFFSRSSFLKEYKSTLLKLNKRLNELAILPFNVDADNLTSEDILNLPEFISKAHSVKIIVVFHEFQDIMAFDNCDDFLYEFEKTVVKHSEVQYLFTGSRINGMKFIFTERKFFFNFVNVMEMSYPSKDECFNYLEEKFIRFGKEIDRETADRMYDLCGGHPWYIMQLASLCHSITPGYVTNRIVMESMEKLTSIHSIRFMETISSFTENQFNLLQAVLDHVERFSSSETLARYHLNSSAQIARSREFLIKKEIISFNKDGQAYIIDPLFEYWLKNYFI